MSVQVATRTVATAACLMKISAHWVTPIPLARGQETNACNAINSRIVTAAHSINPSALQAIRIRTAHGQELTARTATSSRVPRIAIALNFLNICAQHLTHTPPARGPGLSARIA